MYFVPIVLFLIVWMWPRIWTRVTYGNVEATLSVNKSEIHIGERLTIEVELRNKSWLPCPQVEIKLQLPAGYSANANDFVSDVSYVTYLNLRQKLTIQFECFAYARGNWSFSTVELQLNEGFGLHTYGQSLSVHAQSVVLPKLLELDTMRPEFRQLLGRIELLRWLHPDEALLRGIRPYQAGDSFRHISFSATAKTGSWMTKQFLSSTETTVHLILNGQFTEPFWSGTLNEEFDSLCSLLATYAFLLERRGLRLEFSSNAWIGQGRGIRYVFGEQSAQGIYSFLGRATSFPNASFDVLLNHEHMSSSKSPLIIFTSFLTPSQTQGIRRLSQTGREVYLVLGPNANPTLRSIPGVKTLSHGSLPGKGAAVSYG